MWHAWARCRGECGTCRRSFEPSPPRCVAAVRHGRRAHAGGNPATAAGRSVPPLCGAFRRDRSSSAVQLGVRAHLWAQLHQHAPLPPQGVLAVRRERSACVRPSHLRNRAARAAAHGRPRARGEQVGAGDAPRGGAERMYRARARAPAGRAARAAAAGVTAQDGGHSSHAMRGRAAGQPCCRAKRCARTCESRAALGSAAVPTAAAASHCRVRGGNG